MRRLTGTAAAVAGTALAAVLLTGCGGGSGGKAPAHAGGAGGSSAPAATDGGAKPPASASPSGPSGSPSSSAAGSAPGQETVDQVAAKLKGTWQGETDGSIVTLAVQGVQAAVIADGHVCQGTIQEMGVPMLSMTCTDGDKNRVMGIVQSNDGSTAVIAWGDTKRDTLKRMKSLPSGLPSLPSGTPPSAGLPSVGPSAR
ncbi:hypothetical protein [Streptomyces fuscigenes]|uniref:hypothetical protein n=1 Tax=Streptomyces fuscigenes TaxID=1528880 RepID=UPI0022A89556|nr:hypothetical protein [Streptomyces fuscigenes]